MKELDVVKLVKDFGKIKAGTEGVIVCEYDGKAFEVEFIDNIGQTIDVQTVPTEFLEPITRYKPLDYKNEK